MRRSRRSVFTTPDDTKRRRPNQIQPRASSQVTKTQRAPLQQRNPRPCFALENADFVCTHTRSNMAVLLIDGHCVSKAAEHAAVTFERLVVLIEQKRRTFDFAGMSRKGMCILVGEGDLSFAHALARAPKSRPANIVATTFETERSICPAGRANARLLIGLGAKVLHGVDARNLDDRRLPAMADLIAFQFPNTGTRRSVHGRTDNHVLLRRFLRAATSRLTATGRIAVTLVNSPHHLGAFDPPAAADWAGCEAVDVLPFYRSAWAGYGHVNTNDVSESALSKYRSCSTWVFRPVRR